MRRLFLLDNYDSFTYILFNYFRQLGADIIVKRNDAITIEEISYLDIDAIVLSPGPRTPSEAGIMMAVIDEFKEELPILGICLGHQALGEYYGAELIKAEKPMHGKTSIIHYSTSPLFEGIPNPFTAMRYHSLILKHVPENFTSLAQTDGNELMAMKHDTLPLIGIQFHPESVLTEEGLKLLANWLKTLDNEAN